MVFVFLLLCIGVCVAHAVHDGLKYTQSHEWVKTTGDVATVGITDHAQASELAGDIIYIYLRYSLLVLCQLSSSSSS